jgi:ABC-type multidrug transport system ATPase subunit
MGASGAGKTSLLNILSDRCALTGNATLSGDILFNDEVPVN